MVVVAYLFALLGRLGGHLERSKMNSNQLFFESMRSSVQLQDNLGAFRSPCKSKVNTHNLAAPITLFITKHFKHVIGTRDTAKLLAYIIVKLNH